MNLSSHYRDLLKHENYVPLAMGMKKENLTCFR